MEIVPGVDGLVHISDMSWTRRINHPSEVVQKGEEVEAVITSIDSYNQRISLSMKELLPNEWEEYANTHGVGDVAAGKVTNVTDFGVFVELAPGVEGLCHISEIDRDDGLALADVFAAGQTVMCRILRVDWHESRIGLSMHGVDQDGADEVMGAEGADSDAGDTAMAAALRAGGLVEETAEVEDAAEDAADAAEEGAAEEGVEAAEADGSAGEEIATDSAEEIAAEAVSDEEVEAESSSEEEATAEEISEEEITAEDASEEDVQADEAATEEEVAADAETDEENAAEAGTEPTVEAKDAVEETETVVDEVEEAEAAAEEGSDDDGGSSEEVPEDEDASEGDVEEKKE
jgi:ribosomal protein S1